MTTPTESKGLDDNLLTRQHAIRNSITQIREKKTKLVAAMKAISENEEPDKETLKKLMEAFDLMSSQEGQYISLMSDIANIHLQATTDVSKEVENKIEEVKNRQLQKDEGVDDIADEDVGVEMQKVLKDLQDASAQAIVASQLNEQLVTKLQLHKNKRSQMVAERRTKDEALTQRAKQALTEVEMTKLKLATSRLENDRKKKELEDLKKQAMKKTIEAGAEEEHLKETVVNEVAASTDDVNRLPPVPSVEDEEKPVEVVMSEEERLEEKRRQIRENLKKERERREQVNEKIREKLKAMEMRKERMRQLRVMLTNGVQSGEVQVDPTAPTPAAPPATPPTPDLDNLGEREKGRLELEETLRNATMNLQNLTMMRERLENMKENGEDMDDDVAEALEKVIGEEETVTAEPEVGDDHHEEEHPAHKSNEAVEMSTDKAKPIDDADLKTVALLLLQRVENNLEDIDVMDEEAVDLLREAMVCGVCGWVRRVPRAVVDTQLGALVSDCLAPYLDTVVTEVADSMIFDLQEMLINELRFLKLLDSAQAISDDTE